MDALQNYDFTAAASGAEFAIGAPGRLIYYYSGSAGGADSTILVRAGNTGAKFLLKPGQSYKLPAEAKEIDTWYISNYAKTSPIIGVLQIGDGDFKDNRISGSVEVIDGGKSRTMAQTAFVGQLAVAAVAGQYGIAQIINPAASGKRIILEALSVMGSIAGIISIRDAYADLAGAAWSGIDSKLLGAGVASVASLKTKTSAALPGTKDIYFFGVAAYVSTAVKLNEPIVLQPGAAITFVNQTPNSALYVAFEHFEEAAS